MNNAFSFEPTKFEDVRTGEVSFGYRAYDECNKCYYNLWESIPDDDLEFLALVIKDAEDLCENLLVIMKAEQQGCYIGPVFYEWNQISHLFKDF